MPRLKDKAISVVGSASAVNMAASATIFTSEPGKTTVVTDVWISKPTASLAAATSINFGAYYANSQVLTLAAATATTDVLHLRPQVTATKWTVLPPNTAFNYAVTTGAAASANIHVFGYTY